MTSDSTNPLTTTIFYDERYRAAGYAFETTRKSALIADLLSSRLPNHALRSPEPWADATRRLIDEMHSPRYVEAVLSGEPVDLAESQGFSWDAGLATSVLAHNEGCVAAVELALADGGVVGTLSSGLHHARTDHGAGYCTFNGVAIGARHAADLGADRVLVLDVDAHGGGGTYSMTRGLAADGRFVQVDVTVSIYDVETPTDDEHDVLLLAPSDDEGYLATVDAALDRAGALHADRPFDLVIVNAGVDPINAGISAAALRDREERVARFVRSAGAGCAFTMAGGYTWGGFTLDDIAELHLATIEAMTA
jgi:acetoin utilization deacetylase AcuC-like enzyme